MSTTTLEDAEATDEARRCWLVLNAARAQLHQALRRMQPATGLSAEVREALAAADAAEERWRAATARAERLEVDVSPQG